MKRETSISVEQLYDNSTNHNNLSESIKRLAIHNSIQSNSDTISIENNMSIQPLHLQFPESSSNNNMMKTMMSNMNDGFYLKYELGKEIGKGGFSMVYQCKDRSNGNTYAVKIIDLRPLRLRERFNPARLRREVDITRRLRHPNIIQFIEVFETSDELMIVMEYCLGKELFDVILEKQYLSEANAKPIFAQIARAIYYLHSMNIIHRDIKPENVLVLNDLDPYTELPVAKLLDFGLSKNASAGSAAKTFVGTPCYLAPEVEFTSKGLGGTYGLPADCWSLGAVLYVMLVARFPEFERDETGKVVVKLSPNLWGNISSEAKDLIRLLMNTNPAARLTAAGVLHHPWLDQFQSSPEELASIANSCYDFSQHLQEEEEMAQMEYIKYENHMKDEITASGARIQEQAMVIRVNEANTVESRNGLYAADDIKLAPLLHLQRNIAICLEEAHASYIEMPEIASQVRKGAVLCRLQVLESSKMLKTVEQTASTVLNLFPDLELAVEENEPKLAAEFFSLVRGWVGELKELVQNTQKANQASMVQIQTIVEQSNDSIRQATKSTNTPKEFNKELLSSLINAITKQSVMLSEGGDSNADNDSSQSQSLSIDQVYELFSVLFGQSNKQANISVDMESKNPTTISEQELGQSLETPVGIERDNSIESSKTRESISSMINAMENLEGIKRYSISSLTGIDMNIDEFSSHKFSSMYDIDEGPHEKTRQESLDCKYKVSSPCVGMDEVQYESSEHNQQSLDSKAHQLIQSSKENKELSPVLTTAANRLVEALNKLRQVDVILDQLGYFWSQTEVVLDALTRKGQHVEQFIGFSSKPRLMARFRERLEEYKRFWEGIRLMSTNYINGVQQSSSLNVVPAGNNNPIPLSPLQEVK